MEIIFNEEKNGIEVKFDEKPECAILNALKQNGFRWHNQKKVWFAKRTEQRLELLNNLTINAVTSNTKNIMNTRYDLWEMTRIDEDINNVDKKLSTKEIASIIRKHVKPRFPMCRFSITTGSCSSIHIEIQSSPFEKESDELNAIVHYVYTYANSFKYCTDYNPYGDYGSSYNFYGVYESNIISYSYKQTMPTVAEKNMSEEFKIKKTEFEAVERERKEKELQEAIKKSEIEKAEREKRLKIEIENHDKVEECIESIKDVDYFVLNILEPTFNKINRLKRYIDLIDSGECECKKVNCKVSKEVHLSEEMYDIFSNQLLDDWSFINGTGGSRCEDWRINGMEDYNRMSEEEKSTVEWFSSDCVAVFCNNKLMFVVDAQGYEYCRYIFIPDEDTIIADEYTVKQHITERERDNYKEQAEKLFDASADIVISNSYCDNWDKDYFDEYKKNIKNWIRDNNFKLDINIVRATVSERFKSAMYRILTESDRIDEQFINADFKSGQRITMIQIGDFGGLTITKCVLKSFELGSYAQYNNAVKLIYRPERKRTDYYKWLYRDVLIYDGWFDLPEDLFWEKLSSVNGVTCRKSLFSACDREQYDVVINYLSNIGLKPIINTYKPVF